MTEQAVAVEDEFISRSLTDRRRASFRGVAYGAIVHCRRRGPRRQEDNSGYYVDRYDERLFAVTLGIFVLCCTDAFFTLMLLSQGAEEVNPIMAALLDHGVATFVYAKLLITGLGLVFLVAHAAFWVAGRIRVSHILYAVLGGYLTLFVYQLDMLSRVF